MSDKCPHCGSPTARITFSSNTKWKSSPDGLIQVGPIEYGGGGNGGFPRGTRQPPQSSDD